MNTKHIRRVSILAAIATSLIVMPTLAAVWSSEMHRCELTFPDGKGWTPRKPDVVPEGQGLLNVIKENAGKSVILNLYPAAPWFSVKSPGYMQGLKEGVMAEGATVVKTGLAVINDLDACYLLAEKDMHNRRVSVLQCAIAKDEKLFFIIATMADGSAMEDEELSEIVHSFKIREFDTPEDALRLIPPSDVF